MKIKSSSWRLKTRLALEQPPENRDLRQAGHPVLVVLVVDLVDAGDHRGAAIANQQLRFGIAGEDRHVLAADDRGRQHRLLLFDVDLEVHGAFGGDLWSHLEPQGRIDVLHGDGVVGHRLDRNLETRPDRRLLQVLGRHPRRRDDLDRTVDLGGRQQEVQIEGVQDVGEGEAQEGLVATRQNRPPLGFQSSSGK